MLGHGPGPLGGDERGDLPGHLRGGAVRGPWTTIGTLQ